MPTPQPDKETESEWMERCVPEVLRHGTASDNEEAVAICKSMWKRKGGSNANAHSAPVHSLR